MFDWLKNYFSDPKEQVDWKTVYVGPKDLPSLSEMVEKHVNLLEKGAENKYMQTKDQ